MQDYRDLDGTYDKLLSCEMIEAVGARFLPTYLRTCASAAAAGWLLGLQAITIADQHYDAALRYVDYIKRHVFPGSFIPSVTAIVDAATKHTTCGSCTCRTSASTTRRRCNTGGGRYWPIRGRS
jgi:cyclopropane-fatty-acyl-phospholipid synthase